MIANHPQHQQIIRNHGMNRLVKIAIHPLDLQIIEQVMDLDVQLMIDMRHLLEEIHPQKILDTIMNVPAVLLHLEQEKKGVKNLVEVKVKLELSMCNYHIQRWRLSCIVTDVKDTGEDMDISPTSSPASSPHSSPSAKGKQNSTGL